MFPVGNRTPPTRRGAVAEIWAMFENRPVEPLYAHTFNELYGIMVTFEFPSSTPPANAPEGQLCAKIFENEYPSGSNTPMFPLAWGIHTMFPEGA